MGGIFGAKSTAAQVIHGRDLTGLSVIITGGASGIGYEAAAALAGAGAHIMLAVRNLDAGKSAARAINEALGNEAVQAGYLDLSNLATVRAFAAGWGSRPLNLLINNAGIMMGPLTRTADGFEPNFGINHLGHFLLSHLLLPALEAGSPSRIVQLSSGAHLRFPLDLEDWNFLAQDYDPVTAYGRSKTAIALSSVAFSERFGATGIAAYSVMPGVIQTGLFKHMDQVAADALIARVGALTKTPEQGASTMVWAAVAPELNGRGGAYLENCSIAGPAIASPPSGVAEHAIDPVLAGRLWDISCDAVHV